MLEGVTFVGGPVSMPLVWYLNINNCVCLSKSYVSVRVNHNAVHFFRQSRHKLAQ
jgi:hypothetical protein